MEDTILFNITRQQAEIIAKHFNQNLNDLQDYEICSLLDELIDEIDN